MNWTLKLEEIAIFLACIVVFNQLSYSWWVFPAWLLVPDIGMLGYAAGNKVGAFTYNMFHHRGLAVIVATIGLSISEPGVLLAGIILIAHTSMDRILGYGLKYETGFKHTHLGDLN